MSALRCSHSTLRPLPSFARAVPVALVPLLFAVGCWGITAGPEAVDSSFDRDTTQCTKQVEQCTCYCAIRCGDACVKRLCYDPCSDGRSDTSNPPDDVRPRDTGVGDTRPPTDSTGPTDADGTASRDSGTDAVPLDAAPDSLPPGDTQSGADTDPSPDTTGQDGTAAEDSSD